MSTLLSIVNISECIVNLEKQLHELQIQKKEVDSENYIIKDKNSNLMDNLQELEAQNQEMAGNIREWTDNIEKLKQYYEEQKAKNTELESSFMDEVKRHSEIIREFKTLQEGATQKDASISSLTKKAADLEEALHQKVNQYKQIETKFEESQKESLAKEDQTSKTFNNTRGENVLLKQETDVLKAKVAELIEELNKTNDKADEMTSEVSLKLKKAEEKLKLLNSSLKNQQNITTELKNNLQEAESQKSELNCELMKSRNEVVKIQKEREILQEKTSQVSMKFLLFKREIENLFVSKLKLLKIELQDLKKFHASNINLALKENEFIVRSLVSSMKLRQEKQVEVYNHEIRQLEQHKKIETNAFVESTTSKFKHLKKELVEGYEDKCSEKDRQIKRHEEAINKLKGDISMLKKENKEFSSKNKDLVGEVDGVKAQLMKSLDELQTKESEIVQTKQKHKQDLINQTEGVDAIRSDFERERSLIEKANLREIENLKSQIDLLKHKHVSSLSSYEQQISQLCLKQFDEAEANQSKLKETVRNLEIILDESQFAKEKLTKETEALRERVKLLERKCSGMELSKLQLEVLYDKDVQNYEEKIEQLNNELSRNSHRTGNFNASTTGNQTPLKETSYLIHEQTSAKSKYSSQSTENSILQRKLSHLQDQIAENNKLLSVQRQDFLDKSMNQASEIRKLRNIVTMSFSTSNESPFLLQRDFSSIEHNGIGNASPNLFGKDYNQLFSSTAQLQSPNGVLRGDRQLNSAANVGSLDYSGYRLSK